MNNEILLSVVTGIVLILGCIAVVCFMLGVVAMAFYWSLERVVDSIWGVRNVCEYLIDKRQRERREKADKFNKEVM